MDLLRQLALAGGLLVAMQCHASPLFERTSILDIELRGPFGTLVAHKDDREEYKFTLTAGNESVELEIRSRGNSRLEVCDFPPLRLNFDSDTQLPAELVGQDRLKMVTHCNNKRRDVNIVLDEYVAYRIFSVISEFGYRTRLLRVTYIDSDGRLHDALDQRYAFVIESDDEFARRTGAEAARVEGILYSQLDDSQATLIYVFQYLIGNTDWSLVTAYTDEFCCHNGDLFRLADKLVLVPYDFDLSGLVDATYARPDSSLRLRSIRTRRYRGYCTSPDTLSTSLRTVAELQADILRVAGEVPASGQNDLDARLSYLEKFFEIARDPDKLLKKFALRCL
jgi:hypothetical protein